MLTQSRLQELLSYNPVTGIFTWLTRASNSIHIGDAAGSPNKDGYLLIQCDSKSYQAHRLAFLYMEGQFPKHHVDHKDGIPSKNAWPNLRLATNQQNQHNQRKPSKNNTSGYLGVGFHKASKKWAASIRVNDKNQHLGLFITPEEAHQAYIEAKRCLHPFGTL